jgi:L-ornithine N5-oxygenase
VASSLSRVELRLNCACTAVEPRYDAGGDLTGWLTRLDDGSVIASRYLVIGIGREPYIPPVFAEVPSGRLVHSSQYRSLTAGLDRDFPYRLAVIGSAQSAAEMYRALQDDLPSAQITWVMRAIGIGAYDKTQFINELFYPSFVSEFFGAEPSARQQVLREMRRTNYAGVEPPFVEELYCENYLDRLTKQDRKRIVTMTDVTVAEATDDEVTLELTSRMTGQVTELRTDLVFMGTGFAREMPPLIRQLGQALNLPSIGVNRRYRLVTDSPGSAACYLQGVNEATHGMGDSLLSVVACRAGDIVGDILDHREQHSPAKT